MSKAIIFKSGLLGDTITVIPTLINLNKRHSKIFYVSVQYNRSDINAKTVLERTDLVANFLILRYYNKTLLLLDIIKLIKLIFLNNISCVYHLESSNFQYKSKKLFFRLLGIKKFDYSTNSENKNVYEDIAWTAKVDFISFKELELVERDSDFLYLKERGILDFLKKKKTTSKIILIGIGSNFQTKKWALNNYKLLVEKILKSGNYFPIILGTSKENQEAEDLLNYLGLGINLCGQTSIYESLLIISKYVDFYVGNDSGLMHIAAIFKKKVLGIFSSIDFTGKWDPVITDHIVVRNSVDCAACFKKECTEPGLQNKCISDITVEKSFESWLELVNR